jgi:hypothetical protein
VNSVLQELVPQGHELPFWLHNFLLPTEDRAKDLLPVVSELKMSTRNCATEETLNKIHLTLILLMWTTG